MEPIPDETAAEMSPPNIPFAYGALFLYVEPILALFGTFLSHFNPKLFLNTMSPSAVYAPSNQVVYDQVAATYALFAFNELVVLRVTNDIRVWKAILTGILICDAIHLYASYLALGPAAFWDPRLWRWEDAINLGTLWGQGVFRVAFLLDVGLGKNVEKKTQ